MTLNFNNTSNSKANNKTDLNAKIKENILNTTMEFKANELKQESMLSDTSPITSKTNIFFNILCFLN